MPTITKQVTCYPREIGASEKVKSPNDEKHRGSSLCRYTCIEKRINLDLRLQQLFASHRLGGARIDFHST